MLLTNEKIEVSHTMMHNNNMTKGDMYGIPLDPFRPSKGLHWKRLWDIEEEDFEKLEQYFINKKNG